MTLTDPPMVSPSVVDPTDASKPTVRAKAITTTFSGDALDRTKGNWIDWSTAIEFDLNMMTLGNHIDPRRSDPPDESIRPTSYDNWLTNDLAVRAFIAKNCVKAERELFREVTTAKAYWEALQKVHLAEGPVKQMELIRGAFNTPIPRTRDQLTVARKIHDDIQRAFDMPGGLSKDTFSCIVLLTMLGDGHEHTRAIILRDMQAATKDKPFLPRHIFSYLDSDTQLLLGTTATSTSTTAIALAAKPTPRNRVSTITCGNCKKPGHTDPYCISPGGGMAGKTIEESKAARRRDREAGKAPSTATVSSSKPKQRVQVTTATGQAYVVEVDDDFLASGTLATNPEFAGVVHSTNELEWDDFDGFANVAFIEEEESKPEVFNASLDPLTLDRLTTSINWDETSQPVDLAKITIAALNQDSKTILSLSQFPFYVDSGASIYITPDKTDFYNLKKIEPREVGGVGTTSVTAIGMGDIRLRISTDVTLILHNALYIPAATVRLISVSAITRDSKINILFDDRKCYFIDRISQKTIARGTLTSKRLYSLNLPGASTDHVFTVTQPANIETWHRRLGHANYQVIQDMARKDIVKGMPATFPNIPPKCESCILGK